MSEKKIVHIQRVTIVFSAFDDTLPSMDALNERIKKFVTEDLQQENEDGRFDGLAMVVEGKHEDFEVDEDMLDLLGEDLTPPPGGNGLLN